MSYRSRFQNENVWLGRIFVFIFGLGCMTWALAQSSATQSHRALAPNEVVAIKLEQFKVVKDASGQESLADAKTVKPGDIVEYRATYTNRDGRPVKGLLATLPIPVGMNYLPKTAKPGTDKLEAATKNGEYSREPLMCASMESSKPKPCLTPSTDLCVGRSANCRPVQSMLSRPVLRSKARRPPLRVLRHRA